MFGKIMKTLKTIKIYGAALENYLVAAILFVVIGVTVSVGAYITSQVQSQIGTVTGFNSLNAAGTSSAAYNAAGNAVTGMGTFAAWLPILAIVLVAVVIIALLYGFLAGTSRTGGGVA
jgi:hypothetical protein